MSTTSVPVMNQLVHQSHGFALLKTQAGFAISSPCGFFLYPALQIAVCYFMQAIMGVASPMRIAGEIVALGRAIEPFLNVVPASPVMARRMTGQAVQIVGEDIIRRAVTGIRTENGRSVGTVVAWGHTVRVTWDPVLERWVAPALSKDQTMRSPRRAAHMTERRQGQR